MKRTLIYILVAVIAALIIFLSDLKGEDTLSLQVKNLRARVIYLENAVKALQENPRWEYYGNKLDSLDYLRLIQGGK